MAKTTGEIRKHSDPGRRPGRGPAQPKGRQVDPAALDVVRDLLGERPRRRDLLIEHLHLIQDHFGHISAAHLAALADEMRLAQAEVYEVATFYAHFDVVKETETPPAPLTVRVCDSLTCELMGARALLEDLQADLDPMRVRVVRAPCMGHCDRAPAVEIGHHYVDQATSAEVKAAIEAGGTYAELSAGSDFGRYVEGGGYRLVRRYLGLDGQADFDQAVRDLLGALNESGLRGLGGAGFPTGRKWELVRRGPKPRYLAVNADEGEPGTFKDRYYLERDPHRFLEGALIAAWSIEAAAVYIYLRDEYPGIRQVLLHEIQKLEAAGLASPGYLILRRGAGAYICGEESAMLESIEGKRGLPRHRPPYAAEVGLFGRPTLINNVETLYWIRDIVERGPEWFASQGRHGSKGLRSYSVSGRVKEPGVKLAPAGITANELIHEFCGGMADGHRFKAYLPGGASGGILPASMADIPLDFGQLEKHGCFVGSHAVVVLSDRDDIRAAALNLLRFFADESCGQCTPCRVGCEKAVKLMEREVWDEPLLEELCRAMADASICGLGQAAPNPIRSALRYFSDGWPDGHGQ
ncbi:MAG TPA: NAD(P)H-dependent oxidoreductase subunit E [Geminicoccaceae bacterium]|nr:NAD(P)H-dependent oxidoreductase subunit E [Geminicoccaceae bacterium]